MHSFSNLRPVIYLGLTQKAIRDVFISWAPQENSFVMSNNDFTVIMMVAAHLVLRMVYECHLNP